MTGESVIVDLFCGGGGASRGYARAGLTPWGVDSRLQRHYPYRLTYEDALDFLDRGRWEGQGVVAIHASPPCQAYTGLRSLNPGREYPELIEPVRERLVAIGLPYIIENVEGAPLIKPIRLCGSTFPELAVRRHRLFECSFPVEAPACRHDLEDGDFPIGLGSPTNSHRKRMGDRARSRISFVYGSGRYPGDVADRQRAMDLQLPNRELTQAIPPAYTALIGRALVEHLEAVNVA